MESYSMYPLSFSMFLRFIHALYISFYSFVYLLLKRNSLFLFTDN